MSGCPSWHEFPGAILPVAPPIYGEFELRVLAQDINASRDAAVIFATDFNPAIRLKALAILAEAEKKTGLPTNAVTAFHEKSGITVLVFRDPATATRAEVFEELRHLEWARLGNWNKDLPGVLTAFEVRELDAAAHFRLLLEQGKIMQEEFDATIRTLAHHLSRPANLFPTHKPDHFLRGSWDELTDRLSRRAHGGP